MKIILEGPDLSGKTTLAKALAEALGFQLREKIVRKSPEESMKVNEEDLTREGNWILDRCYWYSDLMYEPMVTGNRSVYDGRDTLVKIAKLMKDNDCVLILMLPTDEVLEDRYSRGDELWSLEQIKEVSQSYEDSTDILGPLLMEQGVSTFTGIVTGPSDITEMVEQVKAMLEEDKLI